MWRVQVAGIVVSVSDSVSMAVVPLTVWCYGMMRLLHLVIVMAAMRFRGQLFVRFHMAIMTGKVEDQVIISSKVHMQACGFGLAIQSAAEYAGYNGDLYDYFFHGLCIWFIAGASCPVHLVSVYAAHVYLKFSNFLTKKIFTFCTCECKQDRM